MLDTSDRSQKIHAYLFHSNFNVEARETSRKIRKLGFKVAFERRSQWVDFFDVIHGRQEELQGVLLMLIELDGLRSCKCSRSDV